MEALSILFVLSDTFTNVTLINIGLYENKAHYFSDFTLKILSQRQLGHKQQDKKKF